MGNPHGGHMGGPPIQSQGPPQGDRFQAVTAYRFVGGSDHKITIDFNYLFFNLSHTRKTRKIIFIIFFKSYKNDLV